MRKRIPIYISISAIATGLSVAASSYFGVLAWVSMVPMVLALFELTESGAPKRRIYLFGILYFELFYAVSFHWLVFMYPLSFTGLGNFASVIVIILGLLGFPLLQAIPSSLVFVLFAAAMRGEGAKRMRPVALAALPSAYAVFEALETVGSFGIPWARLSLSQVELLLPLQSASLFGSYFVTFLIVAVNLLAALAIRSLAEGRRAVRYAVAALAVFLVNLGTGAVLMANSARNEEQAPTVRIGVIQGNHASTEKWTLDPDEVVNDQLSLALDCVRDGAEIIIFSETALPLPLNRAEVYREQASAFASEHGVTLLIGALLYEDSEYRNAVYCVTPSGFSETVYIKRHLVPFGEYVPLAGFFERFLPFLTEISVLSDPMTPGEDSEIFMLDGAAVGSLICFDSIYESAVLDSVRDGAQILAISTNDSWFSDSRGVHMHEAQARLRAIESGRQIARCANTGISSFISSSGRVSGRIGALERGTLCEDVSLLTDATLFSHIGNLFVVISAAITALPIAYDALQKVKKRINNSTRGYTNDEE